MDIGKGNLYFNLRFVAINISLWLAALIIIMSESIFYYQTHNQPIPWTRTLVNDAFLIYWSVITPGLYMILRTWHALKKNWKQFFTKILILSFVVCLLIIVVESIVQYLYRLYLGQERAYMLLLIQVVSFRLHINVILFFTIIGVSIANLEHEKTRRLEEKQLELNQQLMEAELDILKKQMRPHFLFNSLHSISALVLKNENAQAVSMITKFGDLLRESLRLDGQQWITVKEEVDLLKKYLEIHSMRFGDSFSYDIKIELGLEELKVPSLILQPIIENSLVHGIVPNSNKGHIDVVVDKNGDSFVIEVSNDCATDRNDMKEGFGLKNTKKRLATLFDNAYKLSYGLKTEATGFFTKMIFPIHIHPDEN